MNPVPPLSVHARATGIGSQFHRNPNLVLFHLLSTYIWRTDPAEYGTDRILYRVTTP